MMMIEKIDLNSTGVTKAEKALEQAKNRLANEKKKANAAKRRFETHKKCVIGGIVYKYLSDIFYYEEKEMDEILKIALATPQCQKVISDIKARANNQNMKIEETEGEKKESEHDESE
ncbi:MAG: hypothetical protein J6N21_01260 [Butyrivibrio sp.]|nr:hypothetical protein [Butyrivibrio sp.]